MTAAPEPEPDDADGEPRVGDATSADVDSNRALLSLLGTRLGRLRAATEETACIRSILIADMAERDPGPLTCTASFVDVGELI
jgi:hypothetical protein